MSPERERLERAVERIVEHVFGLGPGEVDLEQSFAGDLMAESLDYVDIELHVRQRLGIPFDFARAADEIRNGGADAIRIRDLVDYLERMQADA